jgi:TonB family protein
MRLVIIGLALGLLSPGAGAQERTTADFQSKTAPSQPHIISASEMHKPPTMRPIEEALVRSGVSSVSTSVSLIWDADGHVTNLKLDEPTGSKLLDKAILGWAAKLQLNAEEPGEGTLPMTMSTN